MTVWNKTTGHSLTHCNNDRSTGAYSVTPEHTAGLGTWEGSENATNGRKEMRKAAGGQTDPSASAPTNQWCNRRKFMVDGDHENGGGDAFHIGVARSFGALYCLKC